MDLSIFALLNVAGYWIYGPLRGDFSCYAHKCTWTMLLAYFPLLSFHWTKDLGGTWGTDGYSRGTTPLFSGTGSLSWGFLLGFFVLFDFRSLAPGSPLNASSDALRTGKASGHLKVGCQQQKAPRQESLKNKLLWKQPWWGAIPHASITVFMTGELQGPWGEETKNVSGSRFSRP